MACVQAATAYIGRKDISFQTIKVARMYQELKSTGDDQVRRALFAGGAVASMETSFYSGGYTYTHVLNTKRGKQNRVSKQVIGGVATNVVDPHISIDQSNSCTV